MKTKTVDNYRVVVFLTVSIISLMFASNSPATAEDAEMKWMTSVGGNVIMATGDALDSTYVTARNSSDVFLRKYDDLGNDMWMCMLRDDGLNNPKCMTVDSEGNCYIGGQTRGDVTPIGSGEQSVNGNHAFVAKYNPDGDIVWIRLIGSSGTDIANRLVIDKDNNCYVTGTTNGDIDGQAAAAGTDPFVAKLNEEGEIIWVSQLREPSATSGLGVGVDADGNVYIAGKPQYIATFDSTGGLVQCHQVVGSFPALQDIAADSLGNAYFCGWDGGYTGYIKKYRNDGVRLWERQYRLNGWSCPKSIAACTDDSNDVVTAGCQGGPSGGNSCEAFSRRYDTDGNLVSIYASIQNICGQRVGIENAGCWYVIGDTVVIKVKAPVYEPTSLQLEAESAAVLGGTVEADLDGYSGSGYVGFDGDVEGRIEWDADIPRAGTKTLSWRYMNVTADEVPVALYINGFRVRHNLVFSPTADVEDWILLSDEVDLLAGDNKIEIIVPATGEQGLYVDALEITDAD